MIAVGLYLAIDNFLMSGMLGTHTRLLCVESALIPFARAHSRTHLRTPALCPTPRDAFICACVAINVAGTEALSDSDCHVDDLSRARPARRCSRLFKHTLRLRVAYLVSLPSKPSSRRLATSAAYPPFSTRHRPSHARPLSIFFCLARSPHTHLLEPPPSRRCQERINPPPMHYGRDATQHVVPTLGNYHTVLHSLRLCTHAPLPKRAEMVPGLAADTLHAVPPLRANTLSKPEHLPLSVLPSACPPHLAPSRAPSTRFPDAPLPHRTRRCQPPLSSRSTLPDRFHALPVAAHLMYALPRRVHTQYPPRPHPDSQRLRIDSAHRPATTTRLHLDVAPPHTRAIARSARCPSASPSTPCALPTTRPHTPHVRVVCSVLWATPQQDSCRTLAPCLAIVYSPLARRGGIMVFPTNSSLTLTASSCLSHTAVRSPSLERRLCLAHSHHRKQRLSSTRLTALALRAGTDCRERLRRIPCSVPHCLSPYFSFRTRICYIDVHQNLDQSVLHDVLHRLHTELTDLSTE
ncbi:hypothetical protein C8J57DRAFT_1609894 [Mycena rebaudengoi]|nr:hypothetical protein C8J57DRAFT_1609894 [Mycena rebaudengoi]